MATTIQSDAILANLRAVGHATNLDLHGSLAATMPRVSLTSVHRITARLLERGEIGIGPTDGGTVVLDARIDVHDHFVCTSCGGIVDLLLPADVISVIQAQLGQNLVRDGITVRGHCETCRTSLGSAVVDGGNQETQESKETS